MFQTYLGETSTPAPAPTSTPVPAPAPTPATPAPVPAAAPVDGDLIRQAINEAMRHFPVIKKFFFFLFNLQISISYFVRLIAFFVKIHSRVSN